MAQIACYEKIPWSLTMSFTDVIPLLIQFLKKQNKPIINNICYSIMLYYDFHLEHHHYCRSKFSVPFSKSEVNGLYYILHCPCDFSWETSVLKGKPAVPVLQNSAHYVQPDVQNWLSIVVRPGQLITMSWAESFPIVKWSHCWCRVRSSQSHTTRVPCI